MQVSVKKEGSKVSLEIEAPADVVEEAYQKAYKSIVRRVNIPGFRRGKAPLYLVERHVGEDVIKDEAIKDVLPSQYFEAVKEAGIDPVDDPEFVEVHFVRGEPLKFTAAVDVRPDVHLGDYRTLSEPFEAPKVTDEEVQRQFDVLRDRMSELRPLDEASHLEAGNYANCHVKGIEGDVPFFANMDEDFNYTQVGTDYGLIPGLSTALVGMKTGEQKEFIGVFPETAPAADAADKDAQESPPEEEDVQVTPEVASAGDAPEGEEKPERTVKFLVTVKETYQKLVPETEKVLKTMGQDTVEDAKAEIKRQILASRHDAARKQHAETVEKKAVEMSSVDIPKVMIIRRAQDILDRFASRLKESGTDLEHYMESSGRSVEDLRADVEKQAADEVKAELVFDAIAEKEQIEVSQEMLDGVIGSLAREAGREFGAMKTTLEFRGALDGLTRSLARGEALQKLSLEAAQRAGTPIETEVPKSEPAEDPQASEAGETREAEEGAGEAESEA